MIPPKISYKAANWYSPREGQAIQAIIAHDTETPHSTPQGTSEEYLRRGGDTVNGADRKVSIHVWINTNGDSTVMVNDVFAANHAGYGHLDINGRKYGTKPLKYSVNTCTLGFELERVKGTTSDYPIDQLLSAGYWINIWRDRWGKLPIYRHADVDPTRRSDPIGLDVATLERYANLAAVKMTEVPTPEKPLNYRMLVPQVVYTARLLSSRFAGNADKPLVLEAGSVVAVGDLTGDWAWLANGAGFIPRNTAIKV